MSDLHRIEVEVGGETFGGWYTVNAAVVTVGSLWGSTSTQSGASAKDTARMLLREVIRDAMARGQIERRNA